MHLSKYFVMKKSFTNIINYLLLLVIFLGLIELFCFGLYKWKLGSLLSWHHYDNAFESVKLPKYPYGWVSDEPLPRSNDANLTETCAVAFGDSFTYSDEVSANQAWTNQASKIMGCQIDNYGVGGFGTDQAYIMYRSMHPRAKVVLVGIYSEMLNRNLAASWLFYAGVKEITLKPYFDVKHGFLREHELPTSTDVKAIKRYHDYDYFYAQYKIKFPYSVTIAKSLFERAHQKILNKNGIFLTPRALEIQNAIMKAFRAEILNNGSKIAVIFYPTIRELETDRLHYTEYMKTYKVLYPNDCVIDVGPALSLAIKEKGIKVNAGSGHYSWQGNLVVAAEVAKQLSSCGYIKAGSN